MNKLNHYLQKFYAIGTTTVAGVAMLGFLNIPIIHPEIQIPNTPTPLITNSIGLFSSTLKVNNTEAQIEPKAVVVTPQTPIADTFFGKESSTLATSQSIDKQMAFVASRDAYSASLAVVEKHADSIKTQAAAQNVPQDVAIGVALLENGGSDTAVSSAGALGVFQLMPGTARNLGLTVNKKSDERKDPEKNIAAGISYLAANFDRFGDWGLATWAYHAGEGNVAKALKIYAKANNNIDLPGAKDWQSVRDYVERYGVTVHKLLSDSSVKEFTKKLHDDSAGYPYKVVATATLFREAQ